jgi:hypothetical protein
VTGLLVGAAGWAGAAALLLAYALVSTGRLGGRSIGFQVLNLVGSVGLLINGTWHGAWPSAALNAVWLVIGVTALIRIARAGRRSELLPAVEAVTEQRLRGTTR